MKIDKAVLINILKMIVVIGLSTALTYAFDEYNFATENILLVFVIANMIVVLETQKLKYGIISGIICSVIYEFCFVSPKLSFMMADYTNIFTLLFYFAVCVVISIMAYRLQAQIRKAQTSELLVKLTYDNSKGLLRAKSQEDIAIFEAKTLQEVLNKDVCVYLKKRKSFTGFGDEFITLDDNTMEVFNYSTNYNIICGYKGKKYTHLKYKVYPLKSVKSNYGVIVIDCAKGGDLKRNQKEYLKTNISHIVMALEKEKIQDQKDDVKEKIENEELRNVLILNLTSELLEPLKEIGKKCKRINDNFDKQDNKTVQKDLEYIKDKSKELQETTDEIMALSSQGKGNDVKNEKILSLKTVLEEVIAVFKQESKGHTISSELDDLKVSADGELLKHTFKHIIGNSLKYTKRGCELDIKCYANEGDAVIEFADNGEGIAEERLDTIFDTVIQGDSTSTYKVGLNVCKKIIESHSGKIKAYNNDKGGLTIKINLKLEK